MTTPLSTGELLVLSSIMYDPNLYDMIGPLEADLQRSVTLLDWANNFTFSKGEWKGYGGDGGSSVEDWEHLVSTIKSNPDLYGNMVITDVTQRQSEGNMATIQHGDTTIVVFEGTRGAVEWGDNGDGADNKR